MSTFKTPHRTIQNSRSSTCNVTHNVRRLRLERKWSQWQLAKISRLSERTIQRIESGSPPGKTAEMALASAFELQPSDLYRGDSQEQTIDFQFLKRVVSADILLGLIDDAGSAQFECGEFGGRDTDLVNEVLEGLKLWGMVRKDTSAAERASVCQILASKLAELNSLGLWVFGSVSPSTSDTDTGERNGLKVMVLRSDDSRIIESKLLASLGPTIRGAMITRAVQESA
jgi:transcriptional regulator with XRE-family HTH domain